jgi:hypothetical protein
LPNECRTYASALSAWTNVGVSDEIDIANALDTHDADDLARLLIRPEGNSSGQFHIQFL